MSLQVFPRARGPLPRARRYVLALRAAAVCAGGATAALPVAAQDSARGAGDAARAVVVGVGDRVRLKVWREAALSDEFTVDERGEVAFPRLGVLRVAGLPIATLHDSLVTRYAEYLRDPSMSVTVLRRVGVQGEVRAPNLYYVDATKSLRELLTEAGGVNESGDSRRVVIVRDGRTLRVGRAMNQPAFAADLRSGDQVVVPRRSWWSRNAIAALSTAGFALSAALSLLNSLR